MTDFPLTQTSPVLSVSMASSKSYKDKSSNKKINGCKLFTSFSSWPTTPKLLPNHTHSNIHQS